MAHCIIGITNEITLAISNSELVLSNSRKAQLISPSVHWLYLYGLSTLCVCVCVCVCGVCVWERERKSVYVWERDGREREMRKEIKGGEGDREEGRKRKYESVLHKSWHLSCYERNCSPNILNEANRYWSWSDCLVDINFLIWFDSWQKKEYSKWHLHCSLGCFFPQVTKDLKNIPRHWIKPCAK